MKEEGAAPLHPENANASTGRHAKVRIARSLRWAFFTWLATTVAVGIVGGVVFGFGIGHQVFSVPESIVAWMIISSFTVSLFFAVMVFIGGLFRTPSGGELARFAARQSSHRLAVAAGRPEQAQRNLDEAYKVAAHHLQNPMYIADYAKLRNISLDDIHRAVREGKLRIFWHAGIAFVDANGQT